MSNITLYSFPLSGNAHRVELFLSLLGLSYDVKNVDLAGGEQRSDAFKKLNPNGKVPVLVDGEDTIYESTAILLYLASKYGRDAWLPNDPITAATVQKWLTHASTTLANGPAAARLAALFGAQVDLDVAKENSQTLLSFMEEALKVQDYLAGDDISLADVALYTYVAHAEEGGIDLSPYDAVRTWIARIEKQDGFIPMQSSPSLVAA